MEASDRRGYSEGFGSGHSSSKNERNLQREMNGPYYDSRSASLRSRREGGRGYEISPPDSRDVPIRRTQYGPGEFGRYRDDDWKCSECSTWNYPEEENCMRCGWPPSRRDVRQEFSNKRNSSEEVDLSDGDGHGRLRKEHDVELDEFGRAPAVKKVKKQPEFPPCFETHGTSFVFDARSGMFYESESDFFYDPRSKLYFGNKSRTYFSYDESKDPPFVEVQKVENDGNQSAGDESLLITTESSASKPKKTIAIKLKTKSLGNKSKRNSDDSTAANEPIEVLPKVQKQHQVDINKWSERQEEKFKGNEAVSTEISDTSSVRRTEKGEPICQLCRRKFPTLEKLRYHEEVSALHKENLATKAQKLASLKPHPGSVSSTNVYVDRAEQRRILYGPEAVSLGAQPPSSSGSADTDLKDVSDEVVSPHDTLGHSNVGNQMLLKLGWKEGHELGRLHKNGDDSGQPSCGSAGRMVNYWERIESIAAQKGK